MRRNGLINYLLAFFLSVIVAVSSCSGLTVTIITSVVKKELAKGTRSDSLFMGIYLGMPSKAFYAHCWDLNKKGVFTNGSNNTSVLYKPGKDLKYPVFHEFFP